MRFWKAVFGLLAAVIIAPAAAAPPEVITYQGQLRRDGAPLDGLVDLRFALAANRIGVLDIVRERLGVRVVNGLFTVELDFGAAAFSVPRWLDIEVRYPAGSHNAYELIEPQQAITGAPYALHALSANVTLDDAYDSGGAGAGRTITADAGPVQISGPDGLTVSGGISTGPVKLDMGTAFDVQVDRGPAFLAGEPQTVTIGGRVQTGTFDNAVPHWAHLRVGTSVHRINRDTGSDFRFGVETAANSTVFTDQMTLTDTGRLGIGTTSPVSLLHVSGTSDTEPGSGGLLVLGSTGATNLSLDNNEIMARDAGGVAPLSFNADGGNVIVAAGGAGNLGIGTNSPKGRIHVNGDYYGSGHVWLHALEGDGNSGTAYVQARDTSTTSSVDLRLRTKAGAAIVDNIVLKSNGRVGIGTGSPAQLLHVNGTARVNVLQITGGADLSENFEVSGTTIEPGMVVSIDPANPGRLRLSDGTYDRTVAGVLSGAGGVSTGMTMGQEGSVADGKHPVALTGRVYCWVDATHTAVQPGDLLTTSHTPGHAMKVTDHVRAAGAIIGKAMSSLPEGERGLVLVLVSLQ